MSLALRDPYDDGGFSGGTLDRPALKQLIAAIEAGLRRRLPGCHDPGNLADRCMVPLW